MGYKPTPVYEKAGGNNTIRKHVRICATDLKYHKRKVGSAAESSGRDSEDYVFSVMEGHLIRNQYWWAKR